MMDRAKQFNKGISLIELMLALAIIAILLVMATRYYVVARSEQQLNSGVEMVQAVQAASQKWLVEHNDYAGISLSELINYNLLPSKYTSNPWGGVINVDAANNNANVKITFENIPASACGNLVQRINPTAAIPLSCVPTTTGLVNFIITY